MRPLFSQTLVWIIIATPMAHASGPVDRLVRTCERILAPQKISPVIEELRVLLQTARKHYDLPNDHKIQALTDKIDRLADRDLELISKEIQPHLIWARTSRPQFLRVLKWLLRHSLLEIRHFERNARRDGVEAAYAKYWARMDQLFSAEAGERVTLNEVVALAKETQNLMRAHPGPYREGPRAVLGGSVINAQATRSSDLDGYIFPPNFLELALGENRLTPADLRLFDEFDRRMVANPYRPAAEIFDRSNLWGDVQPFALDITPTAIELIYFYNENSFASGWSYTYRRYSLDW